MKGRSFERGRPERRATRVAAIALGVVGACGVAGCLNRPIEPIEPRTTSTIVERLKQSSVDKIDLLLMIDNSRSMADKQQILALAVPDLLRGLVNPKCLDASGTPAPTQPNGPLDPCAPGARREFQPVLDIHIGIVTSSLGGFGSDSCPDQEPNMCPGGKSNTSSNDRGHLVSRQGPCGGQSSPTYENKGFLSWDPAQKKAPPGEKDIGDLKAAPGVVPALRDLVLGVGQIGCGFESQNEGWYRFLVDPEPPEAVTLVNGQSTPQGMDKVLLSERADFLRGDSLLAIIALTDENDSSIKEAGQYWYVAQSTVPGTNKIFHLPRARAECQTNPHDPCCRSCGSSQKGCPLDPGCQSSPTLSDQEDPLELRQWNSKPRFGIEFYYPPERYISGLTSMTVPNRKGESVRNPLFASRSPGLVFLAEIVGVPWQDIARQDKDGKPDLLAGLDKAGHPVGGFKSWDELLEKNGKGHNTWDIILGDFENFGPPLDPMMIESVEPRVGQSPVTSEPLAPPGSPNGKNSVNGHEYTTTTDLQYACVFDLPEPRNCADPSSGSCDCADATNDNPLCEPNPMDSGNRTLQVRAKGYPGLKELAILKGLGPQGIIGSICPAQLSDPSKDNFGYRPAIRAIIDRLKQALVGQCLPRSLTPDKEGAVSCLILEARSTGGHCSCGDQPARQPVPAQHAQAEIAARTDPAAVAAGWDCFCEIEQVTGEDLLVCQSDPADPPVNKSKQTVDGWCYVDATTTPPTGNPKIVEGCSATEKRLVRFVGGGQPQAASTLFITCAGE